VLRFTAEQGVQTNEVQRSWMLLPCFLEVARRSGYECLDLVELGPSAGLNLVWDRYRYQYANGSWGAGDAPLTLSGEERGRVPRPLLEHDVEVRGRVGIDLNPVDVTSDEGAELLKCFVWADQQDRLDRLDRAVEAVRKDPPELVRGDIVALLPDVLSWRRDDALTVVYETAVLGYLPVGHRQGILDELERAAADGPLAFVQTSQPPDGAHTHWGVWIRLWPDDREAVALSNYHGAWLDWLG